MKKILFILMVFVSGVSFSQTTLTEAEVKTKWGTGQMPKGLNMTNTWYTVFNKIPNYVWNNGQLVPVDLNGQSLSNVSTFTVTGQSTYGDVLYFGTNKDKGKLTWSSGGGGFTNLNGGSLWKDLVLGTNNGTTLLLKLHDSSSSVTISDVGFATPNISSVLDLQSTTKGFLPPIMTTVQRDAIGTPANGLMIYNSTTGAYNGYQGGAWSGIKPSISVQTAATLTITPTTADDFVTENSLSGAVVIANPTGTYVEGQTCLIRIKDNGTARAITFGSNYVAYGASLPTTTTISKWLMIGLVYNAIDSKWSTWSSVEQ
jgi:hypothetical protein